MAEYELLQLSADGAEQEATYETLEEALIDFEKRLLNTLSRSDEDADWYRTLSFHCLADEEGAYINVICSLSRSEVIPPDSYRLYDSFGAKLGTATEVLTSKKEAVEALMSRIRLSIEKEEEGTINLDLNVRGVEIKTVYVSMWER